MLKKAVPMWKATVDSLPFDFRVSRALTYKDWFITAGCFDMPVGRNGKDANLWSDSLNPGDKWSQTMSSMRMLHECVARSEFKLKDIAYLRVLYNDLEDADSYKKDIIEAFPEMKDVSIIMVPLTHNSNAGELVEIDAMGVAGEKQVVFDSNGLACGSRRGDWIFAQSTIKKGQEDVLADLSETLKKLGSSLNDICKVTAFYAPDISEEEVRKLEQKLSEGLKSAAPAYHGAVVAQENSDHYVMYLDVIAYRNAEAERVVTNENKQWNYPYPYEMNFSNAVRVGDIVFVSGQLPVDETGKPVHTESIQKQTHLIMEYTENALKSVDCDLSKIAKMNVYYPDTAVAGKPLAEWNDNVAIRCSYFSYPAPCLTGVRGPSPRVVGSFLSGDTIAFADKED